MTQLTEKQQRAAAAEFANYRAKKGYEKGESQPFWLSLLRDVFGVEQPEKLIRFEDQVHLDHTSFIDAMIPAARIMIEQKSAEKDLRKAHQENDKAVIAAYGLDWHGMTESACVAHLMKLYQNLTQKS